MIKYKFSLILLFTSMILLNSCNVYKPVDAKKYPPQPELRVKKNIEEGRGFRLMDGIGGNKKSGEFEFANANPLWRATLEIIDFMPLLSVDYGGGLIITDWYGDENESDSIKISVQFLSNEIRADALKIKVFKKNCSTLSNCKVFQSKSDINEELRLAILQKAAQYKTSDIDKNKREYRIKDLN